jgi:transcriptional regulator with XRE-family HTH domain
MTLPTGRQLRAARALAGIEQREVARRARVSINTINRMEKADDKPVRGYAENVERVVNALRKAGVEITADGVRLVAKVK